MTVYRVFCDESGRHGGASALALGGVILPHQNERQIVKEVDEWRDLASMSAELKWTKVSSGKLKEYKQFVDLFGNHSRQRSIAFRSAVWRNDEIDYKKHHKGSEELGFYKFYYQLLLHSFGKFIKKDDDGLVVLLDQLNSNYPLEDLRRFLNYGMKKTYGLNANVVRSIEPIDSKSHSLVQMADVLTGAIAFQCEGRHNNPSARVSKKQLASHVAKTFRLKDMTRTTPYSMRSFGIWRFRFKEKKEAP